MNILSGKNLIFCAYGFFFITEPNERKFNE